jgi:hypothetical protein
MFVLKKMPILWLHIGNIAMKKGHTIKITSIKFFCALLWKSESKLGIF